VVSAPSLLARGPWDPAKIEVQWRSDAFEPGASATEAADEALDELRQRGSPSHDGLAARMVDYKAAGGGLRLELQPARWALRLRRAGVVTTSV